MKDDGDNNDSNGDRDAVTTGITTLWVYIQISNEGQFMILVMMLEMFFCDNVGDVVGD
jgi:hypothetical protein